MSNKAKKIGADFTEGPILMKMLKFVLPIMATGLLQTLYNASDMIVVGNFSSNGSFAMGAVGACGSLISLCINLFVGISSGVGVCVAQSIGAGRHDDAKKYTHTSVIIALICGFALGIFGFVCSKPLLTLMGTPENLLIEAVPYMKAYFVGMPAMLLYNFLASSLRSSGDSKHPLIFLAISGLANVLINVVMVIGFGLGAIGVGIATTVAQYVSVIMIIVHMKKLDGSLRLEMSEIRVDKRMVRGILQNGLPVGLQSLVFSISNVLIQSTVNSYGDIVVTGNSAAANIESFIYVAMNSIAIAVTTIVGQNVGAGKIDRIKKIMPIALVMVTLTGVVLGGAANLFGDQLLSIYEPGESEIAHLIRQAGQIRMLYIGLPYFMCGCMDCISYSLKGMGRAAISMMVSIFGSCVLRIIWIFAVCPLFPQNISVLYMAYPITWTVTACGLTYFLVRSYKSMIAAQKKRALA